MALGLALLTSDAFVIAFVASSVQFSSVPSLTRVQFFVPP